MKTTLLILTFAIGLGTGVANAQGPIGQCIKTCTAVYNACMLKAKTPAQKLQCKKDRIECANDCNSTPQI